MREILGGAVGLMTVLASLVLAKAAPHEAPFALIGVPVTMWLMIERSDAR